MYSQIKQLAEEALALQNKNFMDATFHTIIELCDKAEKHSHPIGAADIATINQSVLLVSTLPDGVIDVARMSASDAQALAKIENEIIGDDEAVDEISKAIPDIAAESMETSKIAVTAKALKEKKGGSK